MTDAQKKTDEPAVIQVTAGPYAGQRLTMSKAEAEAAIAEKWAIDPTAPVEAPKGKPGEAPKDLTDEERMEIRAKAEAAARKLRGEPELTRDMTGEPRATYETKAAPKK